MLQQRSRYRPEYFLFAVACVVFFFLYHALHFSTSGGYNSPDEMVNSVFTRVFAETGSLLLHQPEMYGPLAEFVHPRSTFVQGSTIVPAGFLGLVVVYGLVAKFLGISAVVYLTAGLAIVGVWAWYGLIRQVFDKRTAFFSALLALSHPAWWYYSARSFFPNVPFVSFLLIGAFFLLVRPLNRWRRTSWWFDAILGAVSLGTAFLIRPNEIIWVAPVILIVCFVYRRSITVGHLLFWAGVGLATIGVFITINQQVYGDSVGSYVASASLPLRGWYSFIFPFGFELKNIIRAGYVFFVSLFWWLTVPAVGGALFVLKEYISQDKAVHRRSLLVYMLSWVCGATILFVYYGSASDQLFALRSIGVSYVRYWLPLYLFSVPLVVVFFQKCVAFLFRRPYRIWGISIVVMALIFFNAQAVYGGIDGLRATKATIIHGQTWRAEVLARTDPGAILITDREDKFFWPDRQVMVNVHNPRIGKATQGFLRNQRPVYYFGPTLSPEKEIELQTYLNRFDVYLISPMVTIGHHSLYPLSLSSP